MRKGQQIWKNWTKWVKKVKNVKKEKNAPPRRPAAAPNTKLRPKLRAGTIHARSTARVGYCSCAQHCACEVTVHARSDSPSARAQRPAAAPPRAQRVFAPFFTCSRPCDVMLTSLMTSAIPIRVFTFFNIFLTFFYSFFLSILTYKYPPSLHFKTHLQNTLLSSFFLSFLRFLGFFSFS